MNTTTHKEKFYWQQWIPITLILLLATGLYFYNLGTESMWVDELYSINDAKVKVSLFRIRPIYYILLKFWMLFGTSDSWLRSLSVVFGLASVFLIYQLGRRVAGEGAGLIAALLLALSPIFINFAQMVRMYSLGTCLALGGSLALVHALENPTNSSMAWWACTRALMNMTAPLNATLLLPDILIFCWKFRKQRDVLLRFGKWALVGFVLWLPSLWTLVSNTIGFLTGALNITAKVETSSSRHAFPSITEVIRKLRHFTAFPFPSTSKAISLFYQAYTIILLFLLSFGLIKKHRSGKLLWMAAWAFIPAAMIFLVSQRLWIDRYLLFVCPYVLILLAAGFMRVWNLQRIVAIVIAIIYLFATTNGLVRFYTVQDRQDWRGIAQVINTIEKPGDKIVLSIGSEKMTTALTHYYNGTASIYRKDICSILEVDKTDLEVELSNLLPIERLWLVCQRDFDPSLFEETFGDKLKLEKHWEFTNEQFYREKDLMYLFLTTLN
ncbi:glycosyltransferase family 39 protein [Dapis sp. BLCC M172]|uniref:glycosyltransferase family 39 protein n=1 Tax=Dapis sp. BLCC M172 TaxID=2975281 RepID=UPI003CE6D3C8